MGWNDVQMGRRSVEWPHVEATILTSKLTSQFLSADQPDIRYEYEFDGRSYISTRIWPGNNIVNMPLFTTNASKRIINQFLEGDKVSVVVDARHPDFAALIAGPSRAYHWMFVFAAFLLLGIGIPTLKRN